MEQCNAAEGCVRADRSAAGTALVSGAGVRAERGLDGHLQPQPGDESQSTPRRRTRLSERHLVGRQLQRWPLYNELAHPGGTLEREQLEHRLHS